MKKFAADLNDKEQEQFSKLFYKYSILNADEDFGDTPWSCPWHWGTPILLKGDSIEEMAKNFAKDCEEEIRECIKQDEENKEN